MSEVEALIADHVKSLIALVQPELATRDAREALAELEARLLARLAPQAEAWDEGYETGKSDMNNGLGYVPDPTPNPYRAATP